VAVLPTSGLAVVKPIEHQHTDDRRTITEVLLTAEDGSPRRYSPITVLVAGAVLGQHYHPHTETFLVLEGTFTLHLQDIDDPDTREEIEVGEGEALVIPARIAHTFVSHGPGLLLSTVDREFSKADLISFPLVVE
jgi:quercetin dioxygenase-like cupin family protein